MENDKTDTQRSPEEVWPTDNADDNDEDTENVMMKSREQLMTIVRRDCSSPDLSTERRRMMEYIPDDSTNLFEPVRTLNFSDVDITNEDDTSQNGDHENSYEQQHEQQQSDVVSSNLIDLEWMEEGNENQNLRIIEGHDSSPLEHQIMKSSISYSGSPQHHGFSNPPASVTSQSQTNSSQSQTQDSQQFGQSVNSQTAFSPLKEDLETSGKGSPNLYDSLDERDAENGLNGVKHSHVETSGHSYPFSGPPPSPGHHGHQTVHESNTNNHQTGQHLSFHESNFVSADNGSEGFSSRTKNVSPGLSDSLLTRNPSFIQQVGCFPQPQQLKSFTMAQTAQDFNTTQPERDFSKPETHVMVSGHLASWEDAENDGSSMQVNSNPLMRCRIMGHGVPPARVRSAGIQQRPADMQQRPVNRGTGQPCPRLKRTEQRQVAQTSNPQGGANRGTAGNKNPPNRAASAKVAGKVRPTVQGAGQPRPVVQGSSMADSKRTQKQAITTNASRQPADIVDRRQAAAAEPADKSLDRISGVGSEGPQSRIQTIVSSSENRSASRTPPIHVQTSVTSPRIASLNKSPNPGQEPLIGRFKVSEGFGHRDDDDAESCSESVSTQMDMLTSASYKMSPRQNELSPQNMSIDIQGMEDVRSHLQNMLRLSANTFAEKPEFDHSDSASELLMDQPYKRPFSSQIPGNVPDLFENFPNYSSTMFADLSESGISKQDMSFQTDRTYMREALEKERYRRKHCEQQIHHLNVRLLEAQQQLAVAIATDKKKDTMIEQLDKQLAKVVEGWKKREREKDEYLKLILKEKSQIEQSLHQQQEMINSFESDMAHTINELKQEKENSAAAVEKLRQEIDNVTRDKARAEEQLEAEKERGSLLCQEMGQLKEAREMAELRAQQLQERLHKEQDDWYRREQELLATIDDVKEANLKVIQMEKARSDEYQTLAADMEERLRATQTQNKKLELDIDALEREKESIKVEIAIIEAKYETSQRKLEADLHSQMEKEIAEQVAQVQEKMDEMNAEMQEKHRQQVMEIHQRHQVDLEVHLQKFSEDARRKDDDYRQQIQNYEERLKEYRNENTALKHAKQKLESQRMEVLSKLQYMMQSQWNEAVSLLVSSPMRNSQGSQNSSLIHLGNHVSQEPMTSSPKEGRSHPHTTENKGNPKQQQQTLQSVNDMERYLESLHLCETDATDTMQTESQGFTASEDQNTSFVSEVLSDSPPPIQVHSAFEDPQSTLLNAEQTSFMDQFFSSQSGPMPRHVHGYLVNQMSKSSASQNGLADHPSNERPEMMNATSLPGAAVMIRPPQQQSRPIRGVDQSGYSMCPPSPKKTSHRVRRRSADEQRWPTEPEHDEARVTDPPHLSRHGMSPPVKQTRHLQEVENHAETLAADGGEEVVADVGRYRLDKDYSDISLRVAEHESRQEELQHYIKMLLDRNPTTDQNLPAGSEILESSQEATSELDLNDTAQAAQLNQELKRIQELRERLKPTKDDTKPEKEKPSGKEKGSQMHGVLPPEQLSEISRLLDEYRTRWETSPGPHVEDSVTQLLDLLQNLPRRNDQKHSGDPTSPKSRSRVQITSSKKSSGVKPSQSTVTISRAAGDTTRRSDSESEKSYPASSSRKSERKLTKTAQKHSKHSAWK